MEDDELTKIAIGIIEDILPSMDVQIAFTDFKTWSIIVGSRRLSGVYKLYPMPNVMEICPVVCTTDIDPNTLGVIIREHVKHTGVTDRDKLINHLVSAGGILLNDLECTCSNDENRESSTCKRCRLLVKDDDIPF